MLRDTFAVQKSFTNFRQKHPELAEVNTFKNMEIYSLPAYVDSGVLEYPNVLKKWITALSN